MNTPESQILTLLSRRDGATIPQIADALGISIGTATKYVGLLLEENALEDCGKTESVTGRRPHRYSLRADAGWFLGVDVNEDYVREMAKSGHDWHNPIWRDADGVIEEW